ncbi:MAG: serine hydrolase [Longimicrobiales bacterium]
MHARPIRWTTTLLGLAFVLVLAAASDAAAQRFPADSWMQYQNVEEAGFDATKLDSARASWEALPSSAFLVVADGAVVAAWGDVGRRFMCHSVRKSFLSALYGVYWDRGELDLNKQMEDLGIDDHPLPLMETEREARILDLLKARSGVFHPAAYAGRTDSRPRGSEGPGRYFAYNNWDFNTLAYVLEQETGAEVFTAFDEHFAGPLGMEDWRVSDGYYHYERDKSRYPAYPFRMSSRDAARFGLFFAREGVWDGTRILSRNWVRRSTATYSIDDEVRGYGFMWWTYLEPRFLQHGMYSAIGVGNQMIAVLPDLDMVIVNRADTYEGEGTPLAGLLDLIEEVLEARTGDPVADPALAPLTVEADPMITMASGDRLAGFQGEFPYPPAPLGLPVRATLEIEPGDGHLVSRSPTAGTFRLYLQDDGTLVAEDSRERYWPVDDDGAFAGLAAADHLVSAAVLTAADGRTGRARALLNRVEAAAGPLPEVGTAVVDLLAGETRAAERAVRALGETHDPGTVAGSVFRAGLQLAELERYGASARVLELATRLRPDAALFWATLAEVLAAADRDRDAARAAERALEIDPENETARETLDRLREVERR